MIIIRNERDAQRLLDMALHVSQTEQCSWAKALRQAVIRLSLIEQAHAEPIERHESWSIPPRAVELDPDAYAARLELEEAERLDQLEIEREAA